MTTFENGSENEEVAEEVAYEVSAPCGAILQIATCDAKYLAEMPWTHLEKTAMEEHVSNCGACQMIRLEEESDMKVKAKMAFKCDSFRELIEILSSISEEDWNKIRERSLRLAKIQRLSA